MRIRGWSDFRYMHTYRHTLTAAPGDAIVIGITDIIIIQARDTTQGERQWKSRTCTF